jgi:hypothetical protein
VSGKISGNSETSSDRLAGSLDVQFLSIATESNCRDLFDLHPFSSYCHSLACALSLAVLSFPGLLGSPRCPILPGFLILWFCSLVYLAGGSSVASRSFIAVVYSCASPVYIALDF